MNNIMKDSTANDSELTSRAVEGHRDAFAQIVARYQSLVNAAVAHDSVVVSIILAILAVAFFFSRHILFQKQEQTVYVLRLILILQFPLLLTFLFLRWEKWTGQIPWQMRRYDLILPAVGFFLFVFGIIHCFLKGKNTVYPKIWTGN